MHSKQFGSENWSLGNTKAKLFQFKIDSINDNSELPGLKVGSDPLKMKLFLSFFIPVSEEKLDVFWQLHDRSLLFFVVFFTKENKEQLSEWENDALTEVRTGTKGFLRGPHHQM